MKFKQLLSLILLIFVTACGTDTGNPGNQSQADESGYSSSSLIVSAICEIVVSCYTEIESKYCEGQVWTDKEMVPAVGLEPKFFESLESVRTVEISGDLTANQESVRFCVQNIKILTCEDETVLRAVDLEDKEPLKNIEVIVPEPCVDSYN